MVFKKTDWSKVRWDARRNKFVPLEGDKPKLGSSEPLGPRYDGTTMDKQQLHGAGRPMRPARVTPTSSQADPIWFRINKDTARHLAELNGVWDGKYAKLSGGLLVMTVTNRLKGLVKKGGEVKWQ